MRRFRLSQQHLREGELTDTPGRRTPPPRPVLVNRKLRPLTFLPWNVFVKKRSCGYRLNGVISYGITESPEGNAVSAFCGWTASGRRMRAEFPWSKYGYSLAQQWIEEQRRGLIEDLL